MMNNPEISIKLERFSLGMAKPMVEIHKIPATPGMSIMDALRYVQENLDPTLAFDCSCRIGICKACAVKINGDVAMACSTVVEDGMEIAPLNSNDVLRDFIVRPKKYARSLSDFDSIHTEHE